MFGFSTTYFYNNYSPVGDILVFAVCMVFFVLMWVAFISKTKTYMIFRDVLILMCAAAIFNILFYTMLSRTDLYPEGFIYLSRTLYHICLIGVLYLYIVYIHLVLQMDMDTTRFYLYLGGLAMIGFTVFELLESVFSIGFHISEDGTPVPGINIFPIAYLFFVVLVIAMIYYNNGNVYRQIVVGVGWTMAVSFLILIIQGVFRQSSFTTATFLFPAFAVLYLIHSNPYDFESGSVNAKAFEDSISYNYEKGKQLYIVSIYIDEFEHNGDSFPSEIKSIIRDFVSKYVRKSVLFQISPGHLVLSFSTEANPEYKDTCRNLYEIFKEKHKIYQNDYKLIGTLSEDEISAGNDYLSMFRYIRDRMDDNILHEIDEKDIVSFRQHKYILSELKDISEKMDMYDERVLVYCQPVYNIVTKTYDTAEALMRLKLDKTGMVFPDRFIPMAEKYNYIQALTMIILSKTCRQMKQMLDEGYEIKRISVNFSTIDVRDVNFCDNVDRIIMESGLPHDKIAIEITESQNQKDFLLMKERIFELQETGIKFYLDDFGTGYSNFERIMELPFDIIKFDRSLTIASGADSKNETMVTYLAHLFSDMGYAVLYEGIEDENDENRCMRMCAKYLQGFKYSKPIPIERLTEYFEKRAV